MSRPSFGRLTVYRLIARPFPIELAEPGLVSSGRGVMQNPSSTEFRLSGGGLTQMLRGRFGVEAPSLSIGTQVLLMLSLLWLPLAALTLFAGTFLGETVAQPFFKDVVPQVRLLIALPVLLLARLAIDPGVRTVIHNLDESGVIPDDGKPRYKDALLELEKARDAVLPDLLLLALAFLLSWLLHTGYGRSPSEAAVTSWLWSSSQGDASFSLAGLWYVLVSGPIFQFVLYRWLWRFLLWARFLYRVSRMPLALRPTHPDLCGGLGLVGLGQQTFAIVFVAFAAMISSTVAHNILVDGATFDDSKLEVLVFVLASIVAIYAPLLFFSGKMQRARRSGLSQYGALGQHLSEAFHSTWIEGAQTDVGAKLKGSADPSAMADYGATFDTVRHMRVMPLAAKGVAVVGAALLVPFLPLYFTEFSVMDLLKRLADALV